MPSKAPESSGSTQETAEKSQPSKTHNKNPNTVKNSGNSAKTGSTPVKDNKTSSKSSASTSQASTPTTSLAISPKDSKTRSRCSWKKVYEHDEPLKRSSAPIETVLSNLKTTEKMQNYWKNGNGSEVALKLAKTEKCEEDFDYEMDSNDVENKECSLKSPTQAVRTIAVPRRKLKNPKEPTLIGTVIQSYDQLTKEFVADLISKIQSSVIREYGDQIVGYYASYERMLPLIIKSPLPFGKRSKAAHSKVELFFIEAFQLIQNMENAWRIDGSMFGDDRKHVTKILESDPDLRVKMREISWAKYESLIDECWRSAMYLGKDESLTKGFSGFVTLLKSLKMYDDVTAAEVEKMKKGVSNEPGCSEPASKPEIDQESITSKMSSLELSETSEVVENSPATPLENSPEPTKNSEASNESKEPKAPEKTPSNSEAKTIKCLTCNERTKMLNSVLGEIKKAEAKAALFENDAKKTDATEVAIRDLKKKMAEMEKVKKEVKMAIENRKKDVEKIEIEGDQLKEKKKNLEGDLEKKQKETSDLQEQNTQLMMGIKEMKLKMDRMPTAPAEAPQTPIPEKVSTKPVLLEWRAKKDAFNKDATLQQKKDKIQSIRMLTTDPKMWSFMEYEMFHFNSTCQIYLEVIEMNIQKIKKTSRTTDLLPLPPYPEITEQFQIALEHLLALPQEPAHHDASNDPEINCYICRNDFVNGDQVLICKTCKKPVHRGCWMEWLTKQDIKTDDQTCGLCRQPMVVRRYE